ncbi:MAG: diguanylate cyclase [Lachnospiraceae bacterium]
MPEQKFVKNFRTAKIIQLCLLAVIEIIFSVTLIMDSRLRRMIYADRTLFILCAIIWVLMIFGFICLLNDFFKLRALAVGSHALTQTAYLDSLTSIPNRHSLDAVFRTYTSKKSMQHIGCAMFTISNLKRVNETEGYQAGDRLIQDFCSIFEALGDSAGFVGRNGGNEFVAVLSDCSRKSIEGFISELESKISLYNTEHEKMPIKIRSAYTLAEEEQVQAFTQLLTATYNKLYHIF